MHISVYNGEKFERGKWWYVIFVSIFGGVIFLSLLYGNYVWALVMFFLLWGYFYYSSISNQILTMRIDEDYLYIWDKAYSWQFFTWYVVEVHAHTQEIKNIVLLTTKNHTIYTFHDDQETIIEFLRVLDTYIPMMPDYHQTFFEKFARKCKL